MLSLIPLDAVYGGLLIGVAALLLLFGAGRIAGISGIVSGALDSGFRAANLWRWSFLAGLIGVPFVYHNVLAPEKLLVLASTIDQPTWLYLVAGLLVGLGAKLGSGCTSGHGVCGIGRFSKRSIIATITFMATAIVVVAVVNYLAKGDI